MRLGYGFVWRSFPDAGPAFCLCPGGENNAKHLDLLLRGGECAPSASASLSLVFAKECPELILGPSLASENKCPVQAEAMEEGEEQNRRGRPHTDPFDSL